MKHIPHLYVEAPWTQDVLVVTDDQTAHMQRVLRLEERESVTYTDGLGSFGEGTWEGGTVHRGLERSVARPGRVIMAVAPPSSKDRARFVVEKLSELGVERLTWLATAHGGRRLPSLDKQRAWARAALEQSRGCWLMELSGTLSTWDDLEPPLVVCVPGAGRPDTAANVRTVAIGPEGGFDPSEIPDEAIRVGLGDTILRVETAAVVAAANFR